jgi:cellulose synthase (UDP-forming)
LELHSRGYRSVYLPVALAAGLATETFAAHVKQRNRWARGMAQILRTDCPLIKPGLNLAQRLNYFNAMLHFFFGFPRLVMVLAPLTYLLFGAHPIRANVLSVIAYILPHITLSAIANSMISRNFRHSFWAGVYEISVAPYTAAVTLLALINPRSGTFQVTDKGTNVDRARFDFSTGIVTVVLLTLSIVGLVIAFPTRLVAFSLTTSNPAELDSILINSAWALANLFVLVAAACVAYEQPQQRRSPRVKRSFVCRLRTESDDLFCRTIDISENGVRVRFDPGVTIPSEGLISIRNASGLDGQFFAERVWCDSKRPTGTIVGFAFVRLDDRLSRRLVELIFTDDNSWIEHAYPKDQLLRSLWYLVTTFWRATRSRTKIVQHSLQEP